MGNVAEIAHAVASVGLGVSAYCLARCALGMQRIIRDTFEARGMLPPEAKRNRGNRSNPGRDMCTNSVEPESALRRGLDLVLRLLLVR